MRLKMSGLVTSIFLFPLLCSSLITAKEPLGECPPGFKPTTTTKGKYMCTSARPKCGQGYTVKGAHYDAAKKQLVYSCAQSVPATAMRPTTKTPKPKENEKPFYTIELAEGYLGSISRRELRMKIEDPEVRAASIRAYDELHRLARAGHARSNQQLTALNRSVDQKYDDLMLAAKGTKYEIYALKCNRDRKKCESNCKQQGKSFCGCGTTAVGCFVASFAPGVGC